MDAERIERIFDKHQPVIVWVGNAITMECAVCGVVWPCYLLHLANEARQAHAALEQRKAAET